MGQDEAPEAGLAKGLLQDGVADLAVDREVGELRDKDPLEGVESDRQGRRIRGGLFPGVVAGDVAQGRAAGSA